MAKLKRAAKKLSMTPAAISKRASRERLGPDKLRKKRKYTKRTVTGAASSSPASFTSDNKETFPILEGLPKRARMTLDSDEYQKVVNTLEALIPKKRHFKVERRLATKILHIAKRDFPKMIVRQASTPDKKYVSVYREA